MISAKPGFEREPVRVLTVDELRARRSQKWGSYPPEILPAFIAETDFAPPIAVTEALSAAVAANDYGYARVNDLPSAFTEFSLEVFGWAPPDEFVFAAPDVMSAIEQIIKLRTHPRDGIVTNPPVYPPFFEVIRAAERQVVEVPLIHNEDEWLLDFDRLEGAFAAGARAYLICSPHNPVGRVWTRAELERVAALAKQFSVTVIADEIHSPLALGRRRHTPYLDVAGLSDSAFAVYSASKAWNIPGLKCALAVAGSEKSAHDLRNHWMENPSELIWRIGNLGVLATVAALRDRSGWLQSLRGHLAGTAAHLKALLSENLPALRHTEPQAGFLVWIDCSALVLGRDPAAVFLERGRVALTAGRDFGADSTDFVRLNIGTSMPVLTDIIDRMRVAAT